MHADITAVQNQSPRNATPDRLQAACEELLQAAEHPDLVTVRSIAQRAGTNVGAISYHFGSLEQLIFSVAERVYLRLNAERLALLQAAVQRAHPAPASVEDLVTALIGPSIRWSLDPQSSYRVLRHMTTLAQVSDNPEIFKPMVEDVQHHLVFVPHFRRIAPWLSEVDIGFRISCLLGVRSQMTRSRQRTEELTGHRLALGDPDVVIAEVIAATASMFTAPRATYSNAVPNLSRD